MDGLVDAWKGLRINGSVGAETAGWMFKKTNVDVGQEV